LGCASALLVKRAAAMSPTTAARMCAPYQPGARIIDCCRIDFCRSLPKTGHITYARGQERLISGAKFQTLLWVVSFAGGWIVATGAATTFCETCRGQGKIRRAQGFFTVELPCPSCSPAEAVSARQKTARSGYVYLLQLAAGIIKDRPYASSSGRSCERMGADVASLCTIRRQR
jgi:hypothetical protein